MLVKEIEKALFTLEQAGWNYGGTAISKRALVHLCRRLDPDKKTHHILELGGGKSTLFWRDVHALELLPIQVTTLEHHVEWAHELVKQVEQFSSISVFPQTLKQISDEEWTEIFSQPHNVRELWNSFGTPVATNQYDLYTIHNTFYAEVGQLPLEKNSIDIMLVDGPHGNGRSLAFPLVSEVLKEDALVLIDDFDHYPFLQNLGSLFHYQELYREILGQERWTLVQLQGRKKTEV